MTQFTVQTNGQTLVVASATLEYGAAAALKSDSALQNAVTLPAVITADTTYYLAEGASRQYVDVVITQVDGTVLGDRGYHRVSRAPGVTAVIAPSPSLSQLAADADRFDPEQYGDTWFDNINRLNGLQASLATATGRLQLNYFTAARTMTVNTITFHSGTAGTGTPTLVKYGLYTAAANGDATCVARTASDTALLASTYTAYPKAFTAGTGYAGSYTLTRGSRYAVGVLQVASTTATLVGSSSYVAMSAISPINAAYKGSQSDIDTTAITSVTAATTGPYWFRLSYV